MTPIIKLTRGVGTLGCHAIRVAECSLRIDNAATNPRDLARQRMKTKVEPGCTAKAKDAQVFVARMDSAIIKHTGHKSHKTVAALR